MSNRRRAMYNRRRVVSAIARANRRGNSVLAAELSGVLSATNRMFGGDFNV